MKKLFLFCLLASFALATSTMAGCPTEGVLDPERNICEEGFHHDDNGCCVPTPCPSEFKPQCPAHATCITCQSGSVTKYQMTGCESGYKKVGNKCLKDITRDAKPTKVVPQQARPKTTPSK